jgi:hypothetical protein
LADGVDQLILHRLYALAATLENEIQMKVEVSLAPLLAKRATMQREFMTTKALILTMENQVASSFPGSKF